jgi:hypothetical protein
MISIQHFFDPDTFTLTYVVWDSRSQDGIVIDPVWDYDAASSSLSTKSLAKIDSFIRAQRIRLH